MQQLFIHELRGKFFMRSPKQNSPTLLYFVVTFNGRKIRLATGVKIHPQYWNKKAQKAIVSTAQSKITRINNTIVNTTIDEYFKRFIQFKDYLCENPSEIDDGVKLLKSYIYNNVKMNCIDFLRKCKDEDKTISDGTKKDYNSAIDNLDKYMNLGHMVNDFNGFTKKYIKNYYDYLFDIDDNPRTKDGKLTVSYINKQISQLWSMLNKYAVDNDRMTFSILQEWNERPWMRKDKTKKNEKGIALRDDEILLLWDYWYKLENQADKDILAVFLLECLTGQRYSDIDKITENLSTIHSITTIQLTQAKTGASLRMGIIFELTKMILAEYDNQMPKEYSNGYSNKRMIVIGKKAGIQGVETVTRHSGNNTHVVSEQKERYKFLTQHTGRRTFITLLSLREWSPNRIKQYTGHADVEMVERYTKIKNSVDYEQFHNAIKYSPSQVLKYVDEDENIKLFGESRRENQNLIQYNNCFQTEIEEAKWVLAMFNVPAYRFADVYDIDELRSMMYCIEHALLKVIPNRKLIKAIFNDDNKSLEDKAKELHELYIECGGKI